MRAVHQRLNLQLQVLFPASDRQGPVKSLLRALIVSSPIAPKPDLAREELARRRGIWWDDVERASDALALGFTRLSSKSGRCDGHCPVYITHLEACKLGIRGIPRDRLPVFLTVFLGGLHFWIPIAVLLYHLIIARHSAELAAFHAVWVMGVIMVLQNPLRAWHRGEPLATPLKQGLQSLGSALVGGGRNMLTVAAACAAAGIVVGVVNLGPG